ncbi:MAG: TIGR03435 family protein [Planctomycetota bacterium]|jgi:uncharacterized protein (TIGR03435 family)
MSNKNIWSIVAIICVALIAVGLFLRPVGHKEEMEKTGIFDGGLVSIERKPEVGFKAPELSLEEVLQSPEDIEVNWETLRGKVVVLEFWGTWCGACIVAIPHLNELAKQFQDKPVQFISITYEDKATVLPFLRKKPMHAWIGLDTNRSMVESYGVKGWPHTVIVNKKGIISAIGHPAELTAAMLEDALAGKDISISSSPNRGTTDFLQEADPSIAAFIMTPGIDRRGETPPLFRVLIRQPEFTNNSGWNASGGRFTGRNITFIEMVSSVLGINSSRIVCAATLSDSRYDVVINLPHGKEGLMKTFFQHALEATFDLDITKELQEIPTYVISKSQAVPISMQKSEISGGMSSKAGKVCVAGQPINVLCNYLESYLHKAIIDKTQLEGNYDFELTWDAEDPMSIIESIRNQLGLEVTEGMEVVEMTILEQNLNEEKNHLH